MHENILEEHDQYQDNHTIHNDCHDATNILEDEKNNRNIKKPSSTTKNATINNRDYFTKHYSVETGKFYYINKVTHECTWDKPKGENVPLDNSTFIRPLLLPSSSSQNEIDIKDFNKPKGVWNDDRDDKRKLKREQRRFIIQRKINENTRDQSRRKFKLQEEQEQLEKDIWVSECQKGSETGNEGRIQVNWKNLGYISSDIYDFERNNPTIQLSDLSLNGNGLDSILDIPVYCLNLKRLSLTCNKIVKLDESIGNLIHLTHLNLLKNGMQSLPSTIGSLKQLQVLDISHNELKCLPASIKYLDKIEVLNLECNQLVEIPDVVGEMYCEYINLNSNQITFLPRSIGQMKRLKRLSCIDNKLKFLPVELFESKTLQALHLSRNYIAELPNAIGKLAETIECLWLDNNRLSALPSNFHMLTHLKELQLERNSEMTNPSLNVIIKGPKEVLKWCEMNLARCEYKRKRNIVIAVQDLLEQANQHKLCGKDPVNEPFESVFEPNVSHRGGKCILVVSSLDFN